MISKNVHKYCSEDISKIENYEEAMADTKRVWGLHHWLEAVSTMKELQAEDLYYNRPAKELIFYPNDKYHYDLPHLGRRLGAKKTGETLKGIHPSEASNLKRSETLKGHIFHKSRNDKIAKAHLGLHRVYHEDGTFHMERTFN